MMGLFRLFGSRRRLDGRGHLRPLPVRTTSSASRPGEPTGGAYVVGEDLGTVQDMRDELAERNCCPTGCCGSRRPAGRTPERALAAVTTHDLPTIAGLSSVRPRRAAPSAWNPTGAGPARS